MDSRRLTVVLLLVVAVTAPVFSGEHPWDSDRTGGTVGGGGGIRTTYHDSTIVRDTTIVANVASSTGSTGVLVNVLTAVWSASWTL
ncbi:MAG: hypothetical protein NTW07_03735 [candidate division Zixibacteria bacterium]|nr:hypothetical protein [candidate division Zixibacteria bacterium]